MYILLVVHVYRGFLQISKSHHLETLPILKKITTFLNSAQKMLFGLSTSVRKTKNKNYFVIQCSRVSLHNMRILIAHPSDTKQFPT